jgi:hypothetical protein
MHDAITEIGRSLLLLALKMEQILPNRPSI